MEREPVIEKIPQKEERDEDWEPDEEKAYFDKKDHFLRSLANNPNHAKHSEVIEEDV